MAKQPKQPTNQQNHTAHQDNRPKPGPSKQIHSKSNHPKATQQAVKQAGQVKKQAPKAALTQTPAQSQNPSEGFEPLSPIGQGGQAGQAGQDAPGAQGRNNKNIKTNATKTTTTTTAAATPTAGPGPINPTLSPMANVTPNATHQQRQLPQQSPNPTLLSALPQQALTPEQQTQILRRVHQQAEERIALGKQLLATASTRLTQQHELINALRDEQQSLRNQLQNDVAQSLQQYDQWLGQADEQFGRRFASIEQRLAQLEKHSLDNSQEIKALMAKADRLLQTTTTTTLTNPASSPNSSPISTTKRPSQSTAPTKPNSNLSKSGNSTSGTTKNKPQTPQISTRSLDILIEKLRNPSNTGSSDLTT